jgi:hypothetical protein
MAEPVAEPVPAEERPSARPVNAPRERRGVPAWLWVAGVALLAVGSLGGCRPQEEPADTPGPLPCMIEATRTPPPGAPTYIPGGPGGREPGDIVDPHIEVCLTATTPHVGDVVRVYAQPVDVGMPIYYFNATDDGTESARLEIRVEPEVLDGQGEVNVASDTSQVLEFVAVEEAEWDVTFVLRARGPGVSRVGVRATGEVHYGYPGPATWSGGESDVLTITVTDD